MSLLGRDTVSVLGIGTHGVKDFADGVNARRKHLSEVSFAQTQHQAKVAPTLTRQAQLDRTMNGGNGKDNPANAVSVAEIDKARLGLNMNDKTFIESVRHYQKVIDANRDFAKGGREGATKWSQEYLRNLIDMGNKSSRKDLGKLLQETLDVQLSAGKHTGRDEVIRVKAAWEKAMGDINLQLDTTVDLNTYKFAGAPPVSHSPIANVGSAVRSGLQIGKPRSKVVSRWKNILSIADRQNW